MALNTNLPSFVLSIMKTESTSFGRVLGKIILLINIYSLYANKIVVRFCSYSGTIDILTLFISSPFINEKMKKVYIFKLINHDL